MTDKKYLWLVIVIGIVLLLSACDDKTSCNSTCENPTAKTFWCDPPYVCDLDSMRCRNPDCPNQEDCECPEEVEQEDPVAPHLQLIVLEGSVYYDQNADGERNEGEGTVSGIELSVVDKSCEEDCAPAASTTTDQEGGFRFEFVPGQGISYIFDVNWLDWPDYTDFLVGNDESDIDAAIAAAAAIEDADDALNAAMDVQIVRSNTLTPEHESILPYLDHVNAGPLLTMSIIEKFQKDGTGDTHVSTLQWESNEDVEGVGISWWVAFWSAFQEQGVNNYHGNTYFECGTLVGNVLTICAPDAGPMPEGDELIGMMVLDADIPLDPGDNIYQYGFVLDSDNDPANNFQFVPPYTLDYFQGTDLWYVVYYHDGWQLGVSTTESGMADIKSNARAAIINNILVFFIPADEIQADFPAYRFSTFGCVEGGWGSGFCNGDVSGIDATYPPIPVPQEKIIIDE
jgi:hypothetical protein